MNCRVSVIIPHYNDLQRLDRCLAALAAQTLPASEYEVIVADNASPLAQGALERIVAGRAQVIIAPERGAGPARNAGVIASKGTLLAFTDADCMPEPQWLAAGLAGLELFDVVGGRVRVATSAERLSGSEGFELVFAFDNRTYVEAKGFSVTANMFCSRATFDAVGDFRNGVPEDADWGQRAVRQNFSIGYIEDAVVWHPARANWAELRRKWERLNREAFAATAGTRWRRLRWGLRALGLPASILVHAPRVLGHRELRNRQERLRTLGTLVRIRMWRMANALRMASLPGGA